MCAVKRRVQNNAYGFPAPYATGAPEAIVTDRNPTVNDQGEVGQLWINVPAGTSFCNVGVIAGANQWAGTPLSAVNVASMLVSPGNLLVDTGTFEVASTSTLTGAVSMASSATIGTTLTVGTDLTVNGNSVLNGDATITGNFAVTGDFDITDTASISITSTNDAAGAVSILANAAAATTIVVQNATGTGVGAITLDSVSGGVTISGGLGTADAINIVAGTAGGGIDIDASTGGINVAAANGAIAVTSGTGAINLSADATATTVNVATGGGVKALTLGSINTTSSTVLQSGTGDILLSSADAISIDAVGLLDINSSAGVISVSNDAVANTVNIATGAAVKALTLGSINTTSSTVLQSGAGNLLLSSTDAISIDAAGLLDINSSAGVISIGNDAVAQNMNIGTGAAARVITVGNVSGVTGVVVNTGTGGFDVNTTGAGTVTIDTSSFSLDSTTASNVTVTGAGQDLTLAAVGGSVDISSSEALATAVSITSSAGASGITMTSGTLGLTVNAPFIQLGACKIYVGAGVPANGLATAVGDVYYNSTAASAVTRAYIATGVGAWTNFTCAA